MKKAKQTLTAALAATLATGALGTVAGASPIDDTFASTLKSVQKAQSEKTQTAINEARVAINAMPKELDWAKGEFSKQVDQVQQPLYTQIIDLIEKGKKEAKQETINEGRKLLVGVEDAYAKTWSSDFDTIQQTLVNNATEAVKAATKSQKAEDITKAEALVAELKNADNADVKKSVEGMEKDLKEKIDIRVTKVDALNATTIQVTVSKDLDSDSIDKDKFVIKNGNVRNYVKEANLVEGKKDVVELTLQSKLEDNKKYEMTVSGLKDSKGGILKSSTIEVKYEKKDVASVEFTSKKLVRNSNVRDMLLIKDEAGRNITKEAKVTFECPTDKNIVAKDGKVSSSAKVGKEVTVRVYQDEKILAEQTVTVSENGAENLIGFTVSADKVDEDTKFEKVTANNKIKVGKTNFLTIFYKDSLGNEKNVEGGKLKKIESLDKDVVSLSGGKLTAKKEGVATIKVQYGDMTEEIQVEVVKDNLETATLTMKDTSISVAKSNVQNIVEYQLKDTASGEKVKPTSAEVKIYRQTASRWDNISAVQANTDKVIKINGQYLPEGDTTAKLIVTYGNVKYEQEFNINVQEAKDIESYELVAVNDENKPVDSLDQKDSEKVHLQVYAIDENGNRVAYKASGVKTVTLYVDDDKKVDEFNMITNDVTVNSLNLEKGSHRYYVEFDKIGGKVKTNDVTITTENSDVTGSFDIGTQIYNSSTNSSLGSIISWVYDEKDSYDSDGILGINMEVVSGKTVKVMYDGEPMTFGKAIGLINNSKTPGADLKKLKFVDSEKSVGLKVNKVTVKLDDKGEEVGIIYPGNVQFDIAIMK